MTITGRAVFLSKYSPITDTFKSDESVNLGQSTTAKVFGPVIHEHMG